MRSYIKRITGLVLMIAITQTIVCNFSWGADKSTATVVAEGSRLTSILSWRPWITKTKADKAKSAQSERRLLGEYGSKTDEEILRDLQNKPDKRYKDMIDLGTLLLGQGEYLNASDKYEMAARLAISNNEVSGALFNKAGAQAYCSLADARQTIDIAARLQPRSYDIGKLRVALYDLSGNDLGTVVAQDQMLRLDPNLAGHEVMDPITATLVIGGGIILAKITHDAILLHFTPPEDRTPLVKYMIDDFNRINSFDFASARGGPGLADYMLKEAKAK